MTKTDVSPIVKHLYVISNSTENLGQVNTDVTGEVLVELAREEYVPMYSRIDRLAKGRRLGNVREESLFYGFAGSNILLEHGVAQPGFASTTDNPRFLMVRLFANSAEEMSALEKEVKDE